MIEPGLRDAGLLLQRILFGAPSTTDAILGDFFRQQRCGQQERARITELVFHALRHRRPLETTLRPVLPDMAIPEGTALACAALADLRAWPRTRLCGLLETLESPASQATSASPLPSNSAAERVSLPDWLWHALATQWGEEEAERLGKALNQPACVDLRINPLRTSHKHLIETLATQAIHATPTPYAPMGLRLEKRTPLRGLEPFKQGLFEVQDEGSQLIAPLLAPKPGWTVVDLCAGGGGKTLHLAALMRNRGKIIATDTDERRLSRLKPRIRRAKARTITTMALRHERDPKLKHLEGRAEAVLVDAPCSGTGTLRRRPEIKWHLQAQQIEALHDRQCALLEAGARLTRPGGHLLYATCSLLRRENQDVVQTFLADNRYFRLQPVMASSLSPDFSAKQEEEVLPMTPFLTLLPHKTGTDGFFAALLQRTA